MRSKKRLLLSIALIFIICIIAIVALVAALAMSPRGYKRSDSPEAAAYNYLLSLVKKDFSTAYGLLSKDLWNVPDSIESFVDDLEEGELLPLYEIQPCVYIEDIDVQGPRATVTLRMQYYDPCWRWDVEVSNLSFDSVTITLEAQEDDWKVIDSNGFFERGWIKDEN